MEDLEPRTAGGGYPWWLTLLAGRGGEEFLLSLKYPFLICLILFTTSFIFGCLLLNRISLGELERIFGGLPNLEDFTPTFLMLFIFGNNALKCLLWTSLGILFGVAPLLFTSFNGFLLGLVAHHVYRVRGPLFVLLTILPHGVVELPTTLLSAAIGVRLGYSLINRLRGGRGLTGEVKRGLALFLKRILPLLLVAAVIEAFVTPFLAYLLY